MQLTCYSLCRSFRSAWVRRIALAAIAPEHRHWVEHYTPGSEKDLAERSIKFEVLTE